MGNGGVRLTRLTLTVAGPPRGAEESRGPPSHAAFLGGWPSVSPFPSPPPSLRAGVLRIVSALPFLPASAAVRTMLLSDISAGRLLLQAPSPPAAATAQVRTEPGGGGRGGTAAAAGPLLPSCCCCSHCLPRCHRPAAGEDWGKGGILHNGGGGATHTHGTQR